MAHAITEYAKTNAIDLIIVGTHGRGAVSRFLMGSVAERVVRSAPCPVLTVHAHERDFVDARDDANSRRVCCSQPRIITEEPFMKCSIILAALLLLPFSASRPGHQRRGDRGNCRDRQPGRHRRRQAGGLAVKQRQGQGVRAADDHRSHERQQGGDRARHSAEGDAATEPDQRARCRPAATRTSPI